MSRSRVLPPEPIRNLDTFEEIVASRSPAEPDEDECKSCHGYGFFDKNGKPTIDKRGRKCLDCRGTGKK